MKTDIVLAGVGGQGSLTASRILGEAAVAAGLNAVVGEIHGMAQRGGVVESTVRIGDVHGSIVSDGCADVIVGFEPVETVRVLAKAGPETLVIMNTRPIVPFTASLTKQKYPELDDLIKAVRQVTEKLLTLDAGALAQSAGSGRAVNSVLLGALAGTGRLPFDRRFLLEAVLAGVPTKHRDANVRAFEAGEKVATTNHG